MYTPASAVMPSTPMRTVAGGLSGPAAAAFAAEAAGALLAGAVVGVLAAAGAADRADPAVGAAAGAAAGAQPTRNSPTARARPIHPIDVIICSPGLGWRAAADRRGGERSARR